MIRHQASSWVRTRSVPEEPILLWPWQPAASPHCPLHQVIACLMRDGSSLPGGPSRIKHLIAIGFRCWPPGMGASRLHIHKPKCRSSGLRKHEHNLRHRRRGHTILDDHHDIIWSRLVAPVLSYVACADLRLPITLRAAKPKLASEADSEIMCRWQC